MLLLLLLLLLLSLSLPHACQCLVQLVSQQWAAFSSHLRAYLVCPASH
jgi:hypothetical protein